MWTYRYAGLTDEMFASVPKDLESFLRVVARALEIELRFEREERAGMQTTVFDLTGSARLVRRVAGGCAVDSEAKTGKKTAAKRYIAKKVFENEKEDRSFQEQSFPEMARTESGLPPHAHPNVFNTDWECDQGYLCSGDRCVPM